MLSLSFKMAWRETRGQWHRFIFFFACIAIGVGAVIGVGLFSANVQHIIAQDARALLGGDLQIRLARPLSDVGLSIVESLETRGIERSHVRELVAMAATVDTTTPDASQLASTQIVELKAVDSAYPLYGSLTTTPLQPLPSLLFLPATACTTPPCHGIIVQESLLIRLGLTVGSPLKIGHVLFTITGTLLKEPDRVASAFSLGPRVILSREALDATDLVQRGSRIRERYLLRLPSVFSLQATQGELQGRLAKKGARLTTYREAQPRIRRFLDQLSTYLGLIGLTALFVGGIGVACTIQGFMTQKVTNIAILKAIGADAGMITRTYLLQSLLLGGIGSLLGAGLGLMLQTMAPIFLNALIAVPLTTHIAPLPIIKGIMLGMLSTLLFTLWPLLMIRQIPPAFVFRRQVDTSNAQAQGKRWWQRGQQWIGNFLRDRPRWGTMLMMGCGLAGLAMWQAHSMTLGLVFMAAFMIGLALLIMSVNALLWLLPQGQSSFPFILRHALANVRRPGNFTTGMSVAIGIGVMVLMTIAMVKTSLLTTIGEQIPDQAPSFFFIDIQPDQQEAFEDILQQWTAPGTYTLTPVVRSRLASIRGIPIDPEAHQGKRNGWYFTREYVLTSLSEIPKDNEIAEGDWWQLNPRYEESDTSLPGVSIEAEAAKNLGVALGEQIAFDIQGTIFPTTVVSTRTVNWGSFSTNFFMILSPGSLAGAPLTYISTASVEEKDEIPLQRTLVTTLPNVTAIKIRDVLQNVADLLHQLAWAIEGLALLCLMSGTIVMIAALSANRYRRLYESAIVKALGATRRELVQSFAIECGIIGTLAGLVGIGLGSVLSWVILTFFLDIPWVFDPALPGYALGLTVLLALSVGLLSTYRVLAQPPLTVLRQE